MSLLRRIGVFIVFFFVLITFSRAQTPICDGTKFYALSNSTPSANAIYVCSLTSSFSNYTLTGLSLQYSEGLAIGPAFGFVAPNPTFWTVRAGTYWYYNGSAFVSSGHSAGSGANLGGSANFIYNVDQVTGNVFKYNGTATQTLVASIPNFSTNYIPDIVCDDQDNFFLLLHHDGFNGNPQRLDGFNQFGTAICSYSGNVFGPHPLPNGTALASNGYTMAHNQNSGVRYGYLNGLTATVSTGGYLNVLGTCNDFASCPSITSFSSNITAGGNPTLTCQTPSIVLTSTYTTPIVQSFTNVSRVWSGPNILTSPTNFTIRAGSPGVYSCTVTILSCPPKTSVKSFTLYNGYIPVNSTVTSLGDLDCNNPQTVLSSFPNISPYQAQWYGPSIISPTAQSAVVVNAAGIYTAVITNTATTCKETKTIQVTSSIAPLSLTITPSTNQLCLPAPVLTLSANGAANYTWSPSLLTTPSTGSIVTSTPTANTIYTLTGVTGVCIGDATISIQVDATPTLVTGPTQTVCSGSSVTLTASGASNYSWMPGNQVGSMAFFTPTSTTTYTLLGANGACTAVAHQTINVNPLPVLTVSANPSTICQSYSSNISVSGAQSYTWFPVASNNSSLVVSPGNSTSYTVSGTNSFGCVGNEILYLTVNPNPTVSIQMSSPTLCVGNTGILTGIGASQYTWLPGGFVGNQLSISPSVSTTYTLFGENLNCFDSDIILVNPISAPLPSITAAVNQATLCSGSSVTLSAIGGNTYTWQPGNISGQIVTVMPGSNVTYTVISSDAGGCLGSAIADLTVFPTPTLGISTLTNAICVGNSFSLSASGAVNYIWLPGGLTNASITITPTSSLIYTLSGSNANCASVQTISLTVYSLPNLATNANSIICNGETATLVANGAALYNWSPGNLAGNTVFVSPQNSTNFTVTGTSSEGCINTAIVNVSVNPTPTVLIIASNYSICSGASLSFTSSGADTYIWYPGNIAIPNPTFYPLSTTNYSVVGTNSYNCSQLLTYSIDVIPTPSLTASVTNTLICSGTNATLSAAGATSYTWLPGGILNQTTVVAPNTNTTYTLIGSNSNCFSSETVAINTLSNPIVSATVISPTICSGQTTTLNANGASTYSWIPGNYTGSSIAVNPSITTVYTVTGENILGCKTNATAQVTVFASPQLVPIASPSAACAGFTSTLTATGANTYTWYPGSIINSSISAINSSSPGFTLVGSNANCTSSTVVNLLTYPTPTINAVAQPSAGCYNTLAGLAATGANSYTWNPSPNFVVGDTAYKFIQSSGFYTVTGTSINGCISSNTIALVLYPSPTIATSGTLAYVCSGTQASYTASGGTSYTWNPGSIVSPVGTFTPYLSGYHTYTVVGQNSFNCTATRTVQAFVTPVPYVNPSASPTTVCAGNSVALQSGIVTPMVIITWNPFVVSANGYSALGYPYSNTIYTVQGTINGSCSASGTVAVSVIPGPTLSVVSSPFSICSGSSSTLTASGANNYTWQPGNQLGAIYVVSPLSNTTYTLTGELTSNGCQLSITNPILVTNTPTLNVVANPSLICDGKSSTLTVTGGSTYTWSPNGVSGSILTITPSSSAIYTVTGNNSNCSSSKTIGVIVNPSPTISIANAGSYTICPGSSTVLTATGANSFTWQPGNYVGNSYPVTPVFPTNYSVTGEIGNCASTETVNVSLDVMPNLQITSSHSIICPGTQATLAANGANTFTWLPGLIQGNSIVVSPVVNTVYTVQAMNIVCLATTTLHLAVSNSSILLSASNPTLCLGESTSISATGGQSYLWNTGATTATINTSPSITSIYTVQGLDANGCTHASTIEITIFECVGLLETSASETTFSLYPNPSNHFINFDLKEAKQNLSYQVLSVIGEVVLTGVIEFEKTTIDLSGLSNGIYYFQLYELGVPKFNSKIIKQD